MAGSEQNHGTGASATTAAPSSPVAHSLCAPASRCSLCSLSWHLFDRPPDALLLQQQNKKDEPEKSAQPPAPAL